MSKIVAGIDSNLTELSMPEINKNKIKIKTTFKIALVSFRDLTKK